MEFTATLDKQERSLWQYHIKVPDTIVEAFKDHKRVICILNGSPPFHCAIMPSGKGFWFIMINKEKREALGCSLGQTIAVKLEKDASDYGMEFPEELSMAFEHYFEAEAHFEKLTPGKKRNLIYLVAKPKKPETRAQKAIVIARHLIHLNGKLDFKLLNQDFKNYKNEF